jgi:hypothetical protein
MNIHHNNNINIRLEFGKEDLEQLYKENDYNKRVSDGIDCRKYAFIKAIDQIYFNDKFPHNQTIKKYRRNDKFVDIHTNGGKWEKRLIQDIMRPISNNVENYHAPYLKTLQEKYELMTKDALFTRLTRPIKSFGHAMLWYGWHCKEIENIGLELNHPDDDVEEKRRLRDMYRLILEKVYESSN